MTVRPKFWILLPLLSPLLAGAAGDLASVNAARVSMPLEYLVDGVVEARNRATLSAEVSGKIEAVNFDVDDFVEQGEVVLRIRDREYRAQQQQAKAALDEANAALREAELEFGRNQDLRKQNLISQAVFDRADAALKSARARTAAAEASLARAREQLDHTVVRAPYSGVVVERHVEPGEGVNPGSPIMTGYAAGQLRVTAHVPQSIIGGLRRNRVARVIVLEDGKSIEVSQIVIHPFADAQNHAFPVRLELPDSGSDLYPGMLVKVALSIGETERLLLPAEALVRRAEVNAVYVIDDSGRLSLRQVRPGNVFDGRVEILAGLGENERVALDPVRAGIEHKRQLEAQP